MKALITTELLRRLPPGPVEIYDARQRGLVLRVRANGRASYAVLLRRGVKHTIGGADVVTPAAAREAAQAVLGKAATDRALGLDPGDARRRHRAAQQASVTYKTFLTDRFEPWALEHLKRGPELVQRHRAVFVDLLGRKLGDLTPWTFERWRTARLKGGPHGRRPKPDTLNSHLAMLKALLAKAVEWKVITTHPLAGVKPLPTDKTGRLRYLTAAEERRLRAALTARDAARQRRRDQANAWRRERGYQEWPGAATPLTTIVLVALNTGLRKSEILQLRREDLDFPRALLTVRGAGAKNAQTRRVPMNADCVTALKTWLASSHHAGPFLFPGRLDEEPLDDVKGAWRPVLRSAKIMYFTFHDLRHTFASKLVTAGVDLNTVRELLGHSDLKMTLRYAHLAPEHKAAAVAKLVRA